uniref:Non-specific lipid-transfer protein n=3 Tax=Zea mays TaxID=4577 RepID=B6U968_MAIZE|nr:nonspecific lipid-transfer protein 3 precursor [Zea mays]
MAGAEGERWVGLATDFSEGSRAAISLKEKSAAMKTTSSGIAVVLLVAMLAVQSAVADISCSDVLNDLSPCLPFLQGKAAKPSESNNQCCDGVRTLYAAADTRPDRQATCRCLKAAYVQVHAVLSAAQELPGDCGLSLSYNITPDIDCDKIE